MENKKVVFRVKEQEGGEAIERILNETNEEMLERHASDLERFIAIGVGIGVIAKVVEMMDKDNLDEFKPMLMSLCEQTKVKAESLRDDLVSDREILGNKKGELFS